MTNPKRKTRFLSIFLPVLSFLVVSAGLFLLHTVPDDLQYIVSADHLPAAYENALHAIQPLSGSNEPASVAARAQSALIASPQGEAQATVYAIDDAYGDFHHETLRQGRLLSHADHQRADSVLLLDEKTAYTLFTGGDAIGKTVTIGESNWRVVGIIANQYRYGESNESIVYLPISAAMKSTLSFQTLEIRANASQTSSVHATLPTWLPAGTFHQLAKEKYAAVMPLQWTLVAAGFLLLSRLIRHMLSFAQMQVALYRQKLSTCYAQQLTGWALPRIGLLLLWFTVNLILGYFMLTYTVAPAYVFTDWIPDNLVSIRSCIEQFWSIHRATTAAVQYTSRESSTISLAAWLVRWGVYAALIDATTRRLKR